MLLGSWCAAVGRSWASVEEEVEEDAVDVGEEVWLLLLLLLLLSEVGLPPAVVAEEEGNLVDSLQSGQFLMTRLTVSLMRTQWYFSAIVAVVLLIPPCWPLCTARAISYCRCGSATTSLSFSISRSTPPSSSGGASL